MHRFVLLTSFLVCTSAAGAADWPHRFGPFRNNSTPEVVQPWAEPLPQAWHLDLGEGYSSPTVADGRLFIHAKVKDQNEEEIIGFDAVTGKQLWRVAYPHAAFESNVGNGPRVAPTIIRGRVYTLGITGTLTCLDAADGRQFWQTNLLDQFHAPIMNFGTSSGPLIEGNRLYLAAGGQGSCLVALDLESGSVIWKQLSEPPTSVTPVMFVPKVEGRGSVRHIVCTSTRGLIGVDPRDGAVLWEFPLADLAIGTLPPPTIVGDTVVACSMLTGTFAFKLVDEDGRLKPKEIWRNPGLTTYFTQNTAGANDRLYAINATLIPQAEIALACVDMKSGKMVWQQPKVGLYQLNMVRTGDDKLLMLDDTHGDLILLDTAAAEYRELARSKVCNPTIISFAVSNGRLYTRDDRGVNCTLLRAAARSAPEN
ncbi:MAG TPA: PQQ-binding-like beta-propeller repeat protein [Pirellulales bacterium]|nr:PQQ-binding-like beta-propeller repeat protein [Pirellulales bacterium]